MSTSIAPFTGPELCGLTAQQTVNMLKQGEVSPHELLEASLERISQVGQLINATVTVCSDRAFDAIGQLSERQNANSHNPGWLAGLPISIKDLTMVSGVRCTYGNMELRNFVPDQSEPLVQRLEERGAIIVGKTNTPEFGAGANTFNEVFGYTRNPWNTKMNAGGSSGGAAASLATGEVWLAQGSDLAGSLRTPAAYCGVVGLRPSPGRCGGGPSQIAFSLEGLSGPMARNVSDLALFLDAMTGYDPRLPISLESPTTPFQDAVLKADEKINIAFSEDQGGFAPVEPEIRTVLRAAMEKVTKSGGQVEEDCPELPGLSETYTSLRSIHYGSLNAYLPDSVQKHFKDTLRENTTAGKTLKTQEIYDAMRQRTVLYHAMRTFLENYDVLAIPVVGLEPQPVDIEFPSSVDEQPVKDYIDWLRFSFLATTTTLPAISVPVGFTASGMPVGLQLVGPPRGEAKLLKTARAIEEVTGFSSTPIDPVTDK